MKRIRTKKQMIIFIVLATLVTTILDLLIIKKYNIKDYLILNFWEWFMFSVGYMVADRRDYFWFLRKGGLK